MIQVVIDFGLGLSAATIEAKAVDLYVLERAFESSHTHASEIVSTPLSSSYL